MKKTKVRVAAAIFIGLILGSSVIAITVCLVGFHDFEIRKYQGHSYIFYGDKFIEHSKKCDKCNTNR